MRQWRAHRILRYSLPSALIIAALGVVDITIQAWRRTIGQSAHGLVAFNYVHVLIVVLLLLAVGFCSGH